MKRKRNGRTINEIGNVHGRLTVLRQGVPYGTRGRTTWICRCECGNEATVLADLLRSGATRSCGCLNSKDEIGGRYGRLLVLECAGRDSHQNALWMCRCICGKEIVTRGSSLREGSVRSCGCFTVERLKARALPVEVRAKHIAFNNMRSGAKTRGIPWDLTTEDLERLCAQNCHYCGQEPSNQGQQRLRGAYVFNGIDRQDNANGYILSNVVSCCRDCNLAKNQKSVVEFLAWVRRVYVFSGQYADIVP